MVEKEKKGLVFPPDFESQFADRVRLFEERDTEQLNKLFTILLFHQNPNHKDIQDAYKRLGRGPKLVADWILSFFTSNK